jgi:hypothetical protein
MASELDQSTYFDAEDEPLDLLRRSDLIDCVDFLPDDDDDGGDDSCVQKIFKCHVESNTLLC